MFASLLDVMMLSLFGTIQQSIRNIAIGFNSTLPKEPDRGRALLFSNKNPKSPCISTWLVVRRLMPFRYPEYLGHSPAHPAYPYVNIHLTKS